MSERFAPPLSKLGESGIGVAATPTGGMGLALDPKGRVPFSILPLVDFVASLPCSGALTLTTADQDVAGCSVDLAPGSYVVVGAFDFQHVTNGAGIAVGTLNVGGTGQSAQALLLNTGSVNGDRATVVQVWVFTIGSTSTVKFQAKKTINAGVAQANATHTTLTYLRYA